jgi:hypothetical protein
LRIISHLKENNSLDQGVKGIDQGEKILEDKNFITKELGFHEV